MSALTRLRLDTMTRRRGTMAETKTIYIVAEDWHTEALTIEGRTARVTARQAKSTEGTLGRAFGHRSVVPIGEVDDTPEAAVERYVTAKRREAESHRRKAAKADERADAAEDLLR